MEPENNYGQEPDNGMADAPIPPGEFGWIGWIRSQQRHDAAALGNAWDEVLVGPGDDCAVLAQGDRRLLFAVDMLLEGTHFDLAEASPEAVGYKLLAVNVSDVAAMGGRPRHAVVGVGFVPGPPDALKAGLYRGLQQAAQRFGVALVGGDVTAWPRRLRGGGSRPQPGLVLSLALLGEMEPGVAAVLRSGARVGDVVAVTGTLGGSLLGRHLAFEPRVEAGRYLARHGYASAMLDISDGLASDVGHICDESAVGIHLDGRAIPVAEAAYTCAAASGRDPLDHALHDGEDFELCLTVPAARWPELQAAWPFGDSPSLTRIGEIQPAAAGRVIAWPDGSRRLLEPGGWDHLGLGGA